MNRIALKAGYLASVIGIAAFVVYTFCFLGILVVNPIFIWTNFDNYIISVQTTNQIFKHIAMILMIVYGVCFVIQVCSIDEIAVGTKKYYAKLAELFGIGFLILICINYFIQITTVRMQIDIGQTNGLEQFIQANPISGMAAINMLGWTIFFGLSCFFAGLALGNSKIEQVAKYAFLSNGVMMEVGPGFSHKNHPFQTFTDYWWYILKIVLELKHHTFSVHDERGFE